MGNGYIASICLFDGDDGTPPLSLHQNGSVDRAQISLKEDAPSPVSSSAVSSTTECSDELSGSGTLPQASAQTQSDPPPKAKKSKNRRKKEKAREKDKEQDKDHEI